MPPEGDLQSVPVRFSRLRKNSPDINGQVLLILFERQGIGLRDVVKKSFIWKLCEEIWRQWWFLLLILLSQLIPPYTSYGYELSEWGAVNAYILTHPIKFHFSGLFHFFQIIPLILLILIFFIKRRITRLFSLYVAFLYILIAFLQSFSISEKYGFAVCVANVITFLALAGLWLWEAIFPKNKFELQKMTVWKYSMIILALFAFWGPVNPLTLMPDFNPVYMFTSGTALSFCMATPLYLAILSMHFPHVNKSVFIATGFVGVMMSLGNVVLEFVIYPSYWWIGVLHIPLFVTSLYSVIISFCEIVGRVKTMATLTLDGNVVI